MGQAINGLKSEKTDEVKNTVMEVRGYVSRASDLLRGLGPDFERIAWLLDDTLVYLDQVEQDEGSFDYEKMVSELERLDALVNSNSG